MAVIGAGRGGGDVGEHRQRHVEVVVGVRAPGQSPCVAELRDAHRAGHRPEVRIGQRNVDGAGADRVAQLAPVGADHVRRRRKPGGPLELGHHLATGEAALGPDGILGVGEHVGQFAARLHRIVEQPAAVGVQRDAGVGEAVGERDDRLGLVGGGQHAALELEVGEAVPRLGRLGEPDDGLGRQRLLVADAQPVVGSPASSSAADRYARSVLVRSPTKNR